MAFVIHWRDTHTHTHTHAPQDTDTDTDAKQACHGRHLCDKPGKNGWRDKGVEGVEAAVLQASGSLCLDQAEILNNNVPATLSSATHPGCSPVHKNLVKTDMGWVT